MRLQKQEYLCKRNFRFNSAIAVVKAEDADSTGPQSDIRYRILDDPSQKVSKYFRIDELTGEIFPLEKFDRELNDTFVFDVEARDSMQSSLPGASGPNKGRAILGCHAFMQHNK